LTSYLLAAAVVVVVVVVVMQNCFRHLIDGLFKQNLAAVVGWLYCAGQAAV